MSAQKRLMFLAPFLLLSTAAAVVAQDSNPPSIECPAPGTGTTDQNSGACKTNTENQQNQAPATGDAQQSGQQTTLPALPDKQKSVEQAPAAGDTQQTGQQTTLPASPDKQKSAEQAPAAGKSTGTQPSDTAAAPDKASIPAGDVLASEFMGQRVYTAANEDVGKIKDLVMTESLDNAFAIVGVGGFLGIGGKDVAVPIKQIKAVKDASGYLRLTVDMTRAQLDQAPDFDRAAMM